MRSLPRCVTRVTGASRGAGREIARAGGWLREDGGRLEGQGSHSFAGHCLADGSAHALHLIYRLLAAQLPIVRIEREAALGMRPGGTLHHEVRADRDGQACSYSLSVLPPGSGSLTCSREHRVHEDEHANTGSRASGAMKPPND